MVKTKVANPSNKSQNTKKQGKRKEKLLYHDDKGIIISNSLMS